MRKQVRIMEQHPSHNGNDAAALNAMLRGELAAVESYNEVLKRSLPLAVRTELERMRSQHQEMVGALRHWVRDFQENNSSAGGQGKHANTVADATVAASGFRLLEALKSAERRAESTYRVALGNPDHRDGFRYFIGSKLLPQSQEHLATLDRLSDIDKLNQVN